MHKPRQKRLQQAEPKHAEHKTRAQAAMEFLLTYGWVILIVIIVIAALSYFGILSPGKLLPGKCMFQAGVECEDFTITYLGAAQGGVINREVKSLTFDLVNKLGKDVYVAGLKVKGKDRDFNCIYVQKDPCETGPSFATGFMNLLFPYPNDPTSINPAAFQAENMVYVLETSGACFSLSEMCDELTTRGLMQQCEPAKLIRWKSGQRLNSVVKEIAKSMGSDMVTGLIGFEFDYTKFYCTNLPAVGERADGEIEVTYFENDPAFVHKAYGDFSAPVESAVT